MSLAPLRRRHEPGRLGAELDPRRLAEAEPARPLLERRRGQVVERLAEPVEVRVARPRERDRHRDRRVRVRVPVVELVEDTVLADVRVRRRARAGVVRQDDVLLERCDRGHGLERRARRIDAGERAVETRVVVALGRALLDERAQAPGVRLADEDARVERRVRREREHLAVPGVERDDRAAVRVPAAAGALRVARDLDPVLERALRRVLEADVDRQRHVVAVHRLLQLLEVAARLPERVDEQTLEPRRPAQVAVERGLDARLADLVPRHEPGVRALVELLLRHLADVAEDVRAERAVRVVANVALDELHPRELP